MQDEIRRNDINELLRFGLEFQEPWQVIEHFEKTLAEFFGAPYAVATDSCSHGIELCLRALPRVSSRVSIPKNTYMSVPMTLDILNIPYTLTDQQWHGKYFIDPYPIIDAATLFSRNSYVPGMYMCISFQFQKHLPIGRGGMIFLDNQEHYEKLQLMVRDGRNRKIGHDNDNVKELGFHYHMIPEDAARGIKLFMLLKDKPNRPWGSSDYTDLKTKDFFKDK